ncbi:FecR domain-containing protein [Stutzerimonas urumqiensis]|uniref:FecR domain-containing protein n=1 Tax=Stutzerimonas urumqiensis TaxID=638269 RepID=UPI000EB446DC|nr:FecR domain-containing protein [Stutzerimonas urumqiensis]
MSADPRVLQEAARWFSVLADTNDPGDRLAWRAWLEASPAHAQAWTQVEQICGHFRRLGSDGAGRDAARLLQTRPTTRRQAMKGLCVALGVGGAVTLSGGAWRGWMADERTAVGEVGRLDLAGGGRLWLNTDTAIDLEQDAGGARIRLHRGEVLAQLGEGTRLSIDGRDGLVLARGARFGLHQAQGDSRLSIFDGAVSLRPAEGTAQRFEAGQAVRFDARRTQPPQAARPAERAWADGVLLADNLTLGTFVQQLGRYRHGYLACDPSIAGLRVVGAYPLGDTERVLDALADTLPIRVQRRLPWWVTLEPLS